jgi:hypothetical protein
MTVLYNNNATTTLDGGITAVATSITVVDASVFPAVSSPDVIYLTIVGTSALEIIQVTDITGNVLTAVRGQDGTTGIALDSGDRVDLRMTAAMLNDLKIDAAVDAALGTPTSGVGTNLTGTATNFTASNVTTNANMTGHVTSSGSNVTSLGSFTVAQLSSAISNATLSGNNTGDEAVASLTVSGTVELATSTEIDTGTDAARAIPIDQFVASNRNIRYLVFTVIAPTVDCAVANDIGGRFYIPFTGTILQNDTDHDQFAASVDVVGTTGEMVVDVNLNGTTIMTTDLLDILTLDFSTTENGTQPNVTTTAVTKGDYFTFDITTVTTTPAKGLKVMIAIREGNT